MNCRRARQTLSAYLDGELPERQKARLEEHLTSCAECQAELQTHRELGQLLDAVPGGQVPLGFAARVRERASAQRDAKERTIVLADWRMARLLMRAAAALALVIGFAAGAYMSGSVSQVNSDAMIADAELSGRAPLADALGISPWESAENSNLNESPQ